MAGVISYFFPLSAVAGCFLCRSVYGQFGETRAHVHFGSGYALTNVTMFSRGGNKRAVICNLEVSTATARIYFWITWQEITSLLISRTLMFFIFASAAPY